VEALRKLVENLPAELRAAVVVLQAIAMMEAL
jgi:hypothetical protein